MCFAALLLSSIIDLPDAEEDTLGQWSCHALLITNFAPQPQGSMILGWFVLGSEMVLVVNRGENSSGSAFT